jgi:hypothetical protein
VLLAPHPHVGAVRGADHARRALAPALGEVTVEQAGWFDDVVVDADQDEIVDVHASSDRNER